MKPQLEAGPQGIYEPTPYRQTPVQRYVAEDREQDLCYQHYIRMSPLGPAKVIKEYTYEDCKNESK